VSSNYLAVITGEKIQPVLVVNKCYKYIKGILFISDHEISLALGLLKGISCVLSHYNTCLLLFIDMVTNFCSHIISGEQICSLSCNKYLIRS
jgi:hypothetical protein